MTNYLEDFVYIETRQAIFDLKNPTYSPTKVKSWVSMHGPAGKAWMRSKDKRIVKGGNLHWVKILRSIPNKDTMTVEELTDKVNEKAIPHVPSGYIFEWIMKRGNDERL